MKEIAHRLDAYIQAHPFDSGDSDCKTVLDQLYQAYAESHESDPTEIGDGFKELEEFLHALIEQLEALKAEDVQPSVGKVIALVVRTAADQKLSFDTKRDLLECLMAVDGITPDEAKLLRELDESKK